MIYTFLSYIAWLQANNTAEMQSVLHASHVMAQQHTPTTHEMEFI